MTDTATIRHGAARLDIRLEKIHEWSMPSWKATMKLMRLGGWLNTEAVDSLESWFPEAARDAAADLKDAQKAYNASYRSLKEAPKDRRESQKYLNLSLYTAVRDARQKEERIKRRYLEFLAAKADLKKEN